MENALEAVLAKVRAQRADARRECDAMAAKHPKALDALRDAATWRVDDVVSPRVAKALGWAPGDGIADALRQPAEDQWLLGPARPSPRTTSTLSNCFGPSSVRRSSRRRTRRRKTMATAAAGEPRRAGRRLARGPAPDRRRAGRGGGVAARDARRRGRRAGAARLAPRLRAEIRAVGPRLARPPHGRQRGHGECGLVARQSFEGGDLLLGGVRGQPEDAEARSRRTSAWRRFTWAGGSTPSTR